MPIIRYVLFASCFVLALLFLLDRWLPPLGENSAGPEVDRSIIRIHSARAWPEKIIFDTSTHIAPTSSSPVLAAESPDHAVGNAFAMAAPEHPEKKITSRPQPVRATRFRFKRTAGATYSRRLSDRQVMVGAF
ncbi:hypothetical protein QRQ56_19990 [Bradyrhizobium sp. U531]|uniref:hypothetical protein n=1 Tax=Bradyrhizobium sp. U531 TaxID=3053458 RepID=UPI003F424B9C